MPSAGAAIVCSIFMASITASACPLRTLSPAFTEKDTTLPALESGGDLKEDERQVIQRKYPNVQAEKANCRPTPGGKKGEVTCPSIVPGEPYYERQRGLEEALRQAEEELAEAETAYRRGMN